MATTFNFIKTHLQRLKKAFSSFAGSYRCIYVVGWEGDNKLQVWTNDTSNFSSSQLHVLLFFISLLMCFYFLTTTPSFIRFHFKTTIFICLNYNSSFIKPSLQLWSCSKLAKENPFLHFFVCGFLKFADSFTVFNLGQVFASVTQNILFWCKMKLLGSDTAGKKKLPHMQVLPK